MCQRVDQTPPVVRERQGAFSVYAERSGELVGYTTCAGCLGGNVEYAPEEMKKNGAHVIHLATGLVVGYPPCRRIGFFRRFIPERYGIPVVVGTHPIQQKYHRVHERCGTWSGPKWREMLAPTMADERARLAYD